MSKFRDLGKGTKGGREEDFEFSSGVLKIRVVPLLASQDGEIERGAAAYVERENKANPEAPPATTTPGNPTYERGVYACTIFRAVLDPEDGQPFFASVDEILTLDRDRLAMLFELQQQAQADFAPRAGGKLDSAQFFETLEKTATAEAGADLPFESWPRATQRLYHRGIASEYRDLLIRHMALMREVMALRSEIASLRGKSTPGPGSPGTETSSEPSATPTPDAPSPASPAAGEP
jgi:hypothetical protein